MQQVPIFTTDSKEILPFLRALQFELMLQGLLDITLTYFTILLLNFKLLYLFIGMIAKLAFTDVHSYKKQQYNYRML